MADPSLIAQIVELDEGFILTVDGRAMSCPTINALAEKIKVVLKDENRSRGQRSAVQSATAGRTGEGYVSLTSATASEPPSAPLSATQVLAVYNFGAIISGYERGVILPEDALATIRMHCADLPDVPKFQEQLRGLRLAADAGNSQTSLSQEDQEIGRKLIERSVGGLGDETEDEDALLEQAVNEAREKAIERELINATGI